MSYRTVLFVATAAVSSFVFSGNSQAAPIAPLPAVLMADPGTLTPVYYYRRHLGYYPGYYPRYYPHRYYHPRYRYYRY
jgi:hypothetical protein